MSWNRIGPDSVMETASGAVVDLLNPDPKLFKLEDVACGLARTCRYAGQTSRFYSVAEHACLVAWFLKSRGFATETQLAGLHHDDAEAYIGDITRPVQFAIGMKHKKDLEARIDWALRLGLSLDDLWWEAPSIKAADEWALAAEAYHLMPSKGKGWYCEGYYDPQRDIVPSWFRDGLGPVAAEHRWLATHHNLTSRREADA